MEYGIDAHWEEGSGSVAVRVSNAVAVIRGCWCGPIQIGPTVQCTRIQYRIERATREARRKSIEHGNLEHTAVHVAVDICSIRPHFMGPYFEPTAARICRVGCINSTLIRSRDCCPAVGRSARICSDI